MIVLLVALIVGWVILSVREALADTRFSALYWTLLSVGTSFLTIVLVGVVFYLALSIKAINLTRRQSNFIDSVTHELKSPIASLQLYLQTLNRRSVTDGQRADFYRFMLEDVDRLHQLINHMLEAARLEQEPIDVEVEVIELAPLLESMAQLLAQRYHIPSKDLHLDLEPTVVRARPFEVDLVFRNLIDNALKYAGPDPQVWVSCRSEKPGTVVTRIVDNGPGIPTRLRRKIFWRFVRLGHELQREKPGTGLGLYIVRTLVKRMRGRIWVGDREEGSGTVFQVTLPGEARPHSEQKDRDVEVAVGG